MKKTVLGLALAFGISTAFAQDLTSKKGEPYLPEAGDWAISFDAAPVLDYAGNLFNGNTSNSSPTADYVAGYPVAIVGKYFKDEKTAYRGLLRIGFGSTSMDNFVTLDGQTPTVDPFNTVTDTRKASETNIVLGGGMEWRKGKTRLQGYYGGMAWIAFGSSSRTYSYGNAFTATNTAPTSTAWAVDPPLPGGLAGRPTEWKDGSMFGLGIRGFVGAEYFLFPKISVGAEYGWGLGLASIGEGEVTAEAWDAGTGAVKSSTAKTGGASFFGLDTDINNMGGGSASLNITFHFGGN